MNILDIVKLNKLKKGICLKLMKIAFKKYLYQVKILDIHKYINGMLLFKDCNIMAHVKCKIILFLNNKCIII